MISEAMAAPDLATREALTQEIMRRYHEQAYLIYLFERVDYYGVRGSLDGFEAEGLFIQYDKVREAEKGLN